MIAIEDGPTSATPSDSVPTGYVADIRWIVATKIVMAMGVAGVSRAELARRMGVSRPFVTKILSGRANLTLDTLNKVATALRKRVSVGLNP